MDIRRKLIVGGALALAGMAANKVLSIGWKAVTGHEPPEEVDEPVDTLGELLVFAAVSGVVVALTRQVALRGANRFFPEIEEIAQEIADTAQEATA